MTLVGQRCMFLIRFLASKSLHEMSFESNKTILKNVIPFQANLHYFRKLIFVKIHLIDPPPMSQHVCDVKLFLKTFCFYFKLLQSTRQKCCFWCCCYFLRVVVVVIATAIFVHFFSQNFLSKNLTFPISSWKQKRRTQIDDAPLGPSLSYCLCPFCTKACSLSKYVLDLLSN